MGDTEIRDIVWSIVQEVSSVERFMRGDAHNKPLPGLAVNCLDQAESLLNTLRVMIVERENR